MSTIKEIAERAGVSIGTVDRALHNRGRVKKETAEKILKIASELEYKPNQLGVALFAKKKKFNIGYIIPDDEYSPSEFYAEIKQGALEEIEGLEEYAISVEFFKITFDFELGEDIYPDISEEIWKRMDGLVTLGGISEKLKTILTEADKRNIPVVLYNMDVETGNILCSVSCDYVQSGRMAAGLVAVMLSESGKVGIFSSDSEKVPSYTQRLYGFESELREFYPEISISFIKSFHGNIDQKAANALLESTLEEYPDTDVIYVINPGDYRLFKAVTKVLKATGIRIITNDLPESLKALLRNGIITATISQNPKEQGREPLRILKDYLIFHKEPQDKKIFTQLQIHLKQNIDN